MMAPPVDPGGMRCSFSYQCSLSTAFTSTKNTRWLLCGSCRESTPSFTTLGARAESGRTFRKSRRSIRDAPHWDAWRECGSRACGELFRGLLVPLAERADRCATRKAKTSLALIHPVGHRWMREFSSQASYHTFSCGHFP